MWIYIPEWLAVLLGSVVLACSIARLYVHHLKRKLTELRATQQQEG